MDASEYDEEFLYSLRVNDLEEAVKLLNAKVISGPNYANEDGNTALHYASANNLVDAIRFLLEECKVNYVVYNKSGNSPLQWAIQTKAKDAVQEILKHDYRVHREEYEQKGLKLDCKDETPLQDEWKLDSVAKEFYGIVEYTDSYKEINRIDLLKKNIFGNSPLSDAFNSNDLDILQVILEHPVAGVLEEAQGVSMEEEDNTKTADPQKHDIIIHNFKFGDSNVKIREMAIRGNEILDAKNAEFDLSGEIVWESSIVASQWLSMLIKTGSLSGKNVLELGAGCGLLGIAVHACGLNSGSPLDVLLTDYSTKTMDNLKFNVDLNGSNVKIAQLEWNDDKTWPKVPYPCIIGSDLVYESDLVKPLCNVVSKLLSKPDGEFFYVFKSTRNGADLLPKELEDHGFLVEMQPAPKEFMVNPLVDKDQDYATTFFPDLECDDFILLHAKWKF